MGGVRKFPSLVYFFRFIMTYPFKEDGIIYLQTFFFFDDKETFMCFQKTDF